MEINSGFIKIANCIAEALAHVNLSEYESRALWCIFRKTWGWNKDADNISISQFEKLTGIDRGNVYPAITRLAEKKIIIISHTKYINEYRVNANLYEWVDSKNKRIISKNNSVATNNSMSDNNKVVSPTTIHPSCGAITTIDNNTPIQNTNNNQLLITESTNPVKTQTPLQELVAYYKILYHEKFNQYPVISNTSWGKWGKLLKIKLDNQFELKEILTLLRIFAISKDSDVNRLGFDLGIFFSDSIFNKIRATRNKSTDVPEGGKYGKY